MSRSGRSFRERSRSAGRGRTGKADARAFDVLNASALLAATRQKRAAEEASNLPQANNLGSVICTHFLQGRCKFGDQCAKKHLAHNEAKLRAQQLSGAGDQPGGWPENDPRAAFPQAAQFPGRPRHYYEFVGKRLRGTLKSFSPLTGYGFISCPETFEVFGRDIYALSDQIGQIPAGNNVSFEVFINRSGQPEAKNVKDDKVFHGYLKSFHIGNGYGFISCEELFATHQRDVFVHKDQVGHLQIGQEVCFTVALNDRKQPQAWNVSAEKNGTSPGGKMGGQTVAPPMTAAAAAAAFANNAPAAAEGHGLYDPYAAAPGSDTFAPGHSDAFAGHYDPYAAASGSDAFAPGHTNVFASSHAQLAQPQQQAAATAGSDVYDPFAETSGVDVYDPFADPEDLGPQKPRLSPDELGKLSVKELKQMLTEVGQPVPSGLTEKADLVALVAALP